MKFLPALAVVWLLCPAAADAQTPAQIVDGRTASERGFSGAEMRVEVPLQTSPDHAVGQYLAIAGQRGARYAGQLEWVWLVPARRGVSQCRAAIMFRHEGSHGGPSWRVAIGKSRCKRVASRPGLVDSEIRGQVYSRTRRRLSRAEINRMADLLEPEAPRRRRLRRRSRRERRQPRMRQETRPLVDLLE